MAPRAGLDPRQLSVAVALQVTDEVLCLVEFVLISLSGLSKSHLEVEKGYQPPGTLRPWELSEAEYTSSTADGLSPSGHH